MSEEPFVFSGPSIVIDPGTYSIKSGFAGSISPRSTIPSIVGMAKPGTNIVGIQNKKYFVGNEAIAKSNLLDSVDPIENGLIKNWDYMHELFDYLFKNELHIFPTGHCVITTEKPQMSLRDREHLAQMLLETFGASYYYTCQQSVLALMSIGRLTGIVFDSGEGDSTIVPVYEGYTIPHAVIQTGFGGSFLSEHIQNLVAMEDTSKPILTLEAARVLKEKACYIPIDFQAEDQTHESRTQVKLPNGTLFECGKEAFYATEALFDPTMAHKDWEGVHQSIFNSVMKCDIDIRQDLYKSILMCGGTAMIPGFAERIEKEVIALAPPSMRIRVFAPPERRTSVWNGGSILGTKQDFLREMAISKKDYQEDGVSLINRRCHS